MEQRSDQLRVRVNIATSVKGVKTYDCTIEMSGMISEDLEAAILKRTDALVAALDARYPAQEGKGTP